MLTTRLIVCVASLVLISTLHATDDADRFKGFPPIHQFRPGERTIPRLTSDAIGVELVRPTWTRAMGDMGGWPTLFRFKGRIFFLYPHVDAHRGKKGEATNKLIRYVSDDEGKTWTELPQEDGRQVGEFVIAGDTVYRYDFDEKKVTHVRTSTDCIHWSPRKPIEGLQDYLWLWGMVYDAPTKTFWAPPHLIPPKEDSKARQIQLVKSTDGVHWEKVSTVHAADYESESAMRIEDGGRIVVMIRKKYNATSLRATAVPPYQQWQVDKMNIDLGGEHFFDIAGQTFLTTRARYGMINQPKGWKADKQVMLDCKPFDGKGYFSIAYRYSAEDRSLKPWAVMDSMGDCSYPHLVETPTEILCAYYSQHEDGVAKAFICGYDKKAFLAGPMK